MTLFAERERRSGVASGWDPILFLAMLLLIAVGITMIYSATKGPLEAAGLDPFLAMRRQAIWAGIGIVAFLLVSFLDYKELQHFAWAVYALTVLGIVATYFFPEVNGAQRWILIGGASLQPSEFAKPAMAAVMAAVLARGRADEGDPGFLPWRKILQALGLLAVPAALIVRQPDLGTTLVFLFMGAVLIWAAGASWRQIGLLAVVSGGGAWIAYRLGFLSEYQVSRITSFLDPTADPLGDAYNQLQSITAIGSGQFAGKGLFQGNLTQLSFVPEQESDFIFTAIGEQLGFIGAVVVIAVYAIILWRLLVIAATADDEFARLLLTGVAAVIAFQVFVNIGMTVRLVPVTGLPLPFLSAGGSSLLSTALALGIANSVWVRRPATQVRRQRKQGVGVELSG
ncbi:MAG: rod shape-determining protein RodA [Acidimicrobiia bacterium]